MTIDMTDSPETRAKKEFFDFALKEKMVGGVLVVLTKLF